MKNTLQQFMYQNIIMNWSNLNKCILVLAFASLQHVLWIFWKFYTIHTPELWQWVDLDLLKSQFVMNVFALFLLLALILPCYLLRKKIWAENILPPFILSFFSIIFVRDAYLVGILSPATLCGYVCLSGLGLLLFKRRIVYISIVIATCLFFYLIYESLFNGLGYAPLFSAKLKENIPPANEFWVASMLYFIIPLLLICLILCEILLFQWRHRESIIEKLSRTDPLTNLYNRRSFTEHIESLISQKITFSVVILDLDHFKNINDQYGHNIGDDALRKVALILNKNISTSDIVARYGGEEFIIAIKETKLTKIIKTTERCRRAIEKSVIEINNEKIIKFTASFGISISDGKHPIDEVIAAADQALYLAKQNGRNQIKIKILE